MADDLRSGAELGNYRVEKKLGEGGMGQVYLAEDTRLFRKVALKILPAEVASHDDRMQRFEQEARAASALNHPNILTIYEIGEVEGTRFIATEFVEGRTLRDILARERLDQHYVLEYAVQIASALSAAHEAGIIHRDIKPENVMVRPDGLVKTLDFGLAKLAEVPEEQIDSEGATRAQVKTAPGVIMGTVQYMSPEQTRGKRTDARSDIWSLGCVIYEMATGRMPFVGETTADIIAEIVRFDPPPLAETDDRYLERLDEIVSKTLEKKPDERYQTAKDLLIDFRRLKKKLDGETDLERSQAPSTRTRSTISTSSMGSATASVDQLHSTLSSRQLISTGIRQHKFAAVAAIGVGIVLLAGFSYGVYRFVSGSDKAPERTNAAMQVQRLTGDGKSRAAAISPDGKFLAYVRADGGELSVWLKQIETNSNIPVVKAGELDEFEGLTFSRDGNFLCFNARPSAGGEPSIYRVATLGGAPPTKLLSKAFNIQFSPDGKLMSYLRFDPATQVADIMIANSDGSNERKLATRFGKQFFGGSAAWSPDGKLLAVPAGDDAKTPEPHISLTVISTETGQETEIGTPWAFLDGMVWHPSGDSMIVVATDKPNLNTQVWEVSYPSGERRRLTNNLHGHVSLSITADGKSIVTGELYAKSGVWVSPDLKPENAKPIMPMTGDTWGFSWTADGRIVYVSDQTGDWEVWIMNADGSGARTLTNDRLWKTLPVASPDGKYVVYSRSTGAGQLVRIDINGGNPLVFDSGVGMDNPDISRDSKWIAYSAWVDGKQKILRVPIDGGEPQILTEYWATEPSYSSDGTKIACFIFSESSLKYDQLAIIPAEGGNPIKTFNIPANTTASRGPVWTPDDKGITMIVSPGELQNLWLQPVDGGEGRMMTDFPLPGVARRDYSLDGRQIALVRGEGFGNAVMITGYR